MTKLKIKKDRLKAFLKACSMKGVYVFTSGKSTKKDFFSSYFLDVNPDRKLVVLTLNPSRNTSAKFTLKDVDVIDDGVIPITDAETILKVFKDNSLGDDLEIVSKDNIMTISDGKTAIEIEQRENKDIDEIKKTQVVQSLEMWDKFHTYNEEGVLIISKDHPMLKADLPYPMRFIVKKADLTPLIGTTLNLTKDNKTALWFDGTLHAKSVQANSRYRLKNADISATVSGETFNFEFEFYSLQSILPNLFDIIKINMKTAKAKEDKDGPIKEYLNLYIVSEDPKIGIESIVAFSSIGREIKGS